MRLGYIYALYYRNLPFYIGQTVEPKKRFTGHRTAAFTMFRDKLVYKFIRRVTTKDKFYDDIKFKPLKVVSIYDLNREEMKYISHCINKGLIIYNNCVKTSQYKVKLQMKLNNRTTLDV